MKIDQIPEEEERVDLKTLPQSNILKIEDMEWREAKEGKTGGLLIHFQDKQGGKFSMKYSKVPGHELKEAMRKLKYTDTDQLKDWLQASSVS